MDDLTESPWSWMKGNNTKYKTSVPVQYDVRVHK